MYKAIVTKIKVRPHPNADRLQLGTCFGSQVVVGLDTPDECLGLFFPADGQVSKEFAEANDLIRRKDSEGKPAGGMFDENRRVRSQKLRGEKSEGFWCPLTLLDFTNKSYTYLKEGDTLDTFEGFPICNKYFTKATKEKKDKGKKSSRGDTLMFHKHVETEQFKFYANKIKAGSLITITTKLHGTSARVSNCLDNKPLNLLEKVYKVFNKKYNPMIWKELLGSRNVILEKYNGDVWYGNDDFRYEANQPFKNNLHKGETIYYEIVGWVDTNTPIMGKQSTSKINDKAFIKKYGEEMVYSYGCSPGTREVYVYRITLTNEDGKSIDYSWDQLKARCHDLGVKTVIELDKVIYDGDVRSLQDKVNSFTEGEDWIDSRHIREGVVIRVDFGGETNFYKNKSFDFACLEGYAKDNRDFVDLEESS